MKVLSETNESVRKNIRTFKVEDGPTLESGPLYKDDVYFVVDTVTVSWTENSKKREVWVEGFRFRDGQLNGGYRHHLTFIAPPAWLKPLVDSTR